MKMLVVFKFTDFDESIKEIAMEIAREFPGVTSVVDVERECQLEVRGEFSIYDLTKELKKIDESAEPIKIGPDGVTEPEVKLQQKDEGKRQINIQEASKPPNDHARSSSNLKGLQPYGWWELAKGIGAGATEQAKVIGVGAAEKAKVIGVGAAEQAKVIGVGAAEKAKAIGVGAVGNVYGYLEKRKLQEVDRLRNERRKEEEMKQQKILQEKKRILQEKKRILQERKEKMRKQDLANNSERGRIQGSTAIGNTGSWWNTLSTLSTGQTSASTQTRLTGITNAFTQTLLPGQTGAFTQDQSSVLTRKTESRPVEKKEKNGK